MPDTQAQTSSADAVEYPMPAQELRKELSEARDMIAAGELTGDRAQRYATLAVTQFWAHYRTGSSYLEDALRLLCATTLEADARGKHMAQQVLFTALIEPLSDAFDSGFCELYDRVFSEIIDCCRRQEAGAALHQALLRFGLRTARDLLERRKRLESSALHFRAEPERVRKVFFPSRVTLGAEVAITATLIARVRSVYPHAECVLLAGPAVRQIFAEDPRVAVREVRYSRAQGLIDQFGSWLDLLRVIQSETDDLAPDEFFVIDPDSRLTQLGLLPMLEDDSRYLFFPSRSFGESEAESIGSLADQWASQVFGGSDKLYPVLSLPRIDWDYAASLCRNLHDAGASHVIVMNFGVGGNPDKRLPEEFEFQLARRFIQDGSTVVLAKGIGEEETARSERLLARLTGDGMIVRELDSARTRVPLSSTDLRCDVLAWQGQVGTYCALIEQGDEYVGYDSGGQHIAAALGTPTIDIFAHSPSPRFMQRWRPYGPGPICVIDATQRGCAKSRDLSAIIEQIVVSHRNHRAHASQRSGQKR